MIWLALHLQGLPLEVFPGLPSPSAVVSRERVVVADPLAISAGVVPGLRLAAAWAFLPTLHVEERKVHEEQQTLRRLACWAGRFTSEVCIVPPQTLLLEVSGSLRLFGGAANLFERVVAACREQGVMPQAALAPTPLAAQWLAIAGDDLPCLTIDALRDRLGKLPLSVIHLSAQDRSLLASFGVRSLADLLRLPRDGLARRLGMGLITDLARALGESPDPRRRFVFPESFDECMELPWPSENATTLAVAGRRLLTSMCGWLAARRSGISACCFVFAHERGTLPQPASTLVLRFAGPTRDLERLTRVFIERLQRLELPAVVESIGLRANAPEVLTDQAAHLFGERDGRESSVPELIEQLLARLGSDGVHALAMVDEHRPENASRPVMPQFPTGAQPHPRRLVLADRPSSHQVASTRPFWLLSRPQELREVDGRPQRNGPLRLLAGPERIESGWWDSDEPTAIGDVRRDYFVALSKRAEWLWIFRSQTGWFLHGIFA